MPNWNQVLEELNREASTSPLDRVRRKYLSSLSIYLKRNVIAYYSGWIQKPGVDSAGINDNDMNGLMAAVHQLDKKKGLDLILHTPGGNLATIESIVDYLRKIFGRDIRAFVPQIAYSAGTMWALSCREIIMGKHSFLGPIDPQFNRISAEAVKEEFERAMKETKEDPSRILIWKEIIKKYHPTFIGDCEKAIEWSKEIVQKWLETNMFSDKPTCTEDAKKVVERFSSHKETKAHNRQIPSVDCKSVGLNIVDLEADSKLQDLLLTVHHAFMHTFSSTSAIKIIENHEGKALVSFHSVQLKR
ncbi:MAG: S49 family peptidase [Candidatus Omnitrophica bacterium]|nr:S49 family peptidase [Candidatus Omnitrophota bacterium]